MRSVIVLTVALAWASMSAPTAPVGQSAPATRVDRLLAHMTLAQKVGQMFMFSFDGTDADPEEAGMVRDWGAGGLILYRPNVVSAPRLRALIARVQRATRVPLLIATDEEGGSISSMVPFSIGVHRLLTPQQYGQLDSPNRVYGDALAAGRDLRALGVNMNLAPVLDVLIDPHSPIGTRSYGNNPALVARLGTAAIRGYQDAGIAATAKHFLGLGGVLLDAHLMRPTIHRSLRQLERVELVPVRAAIRAGVDALMVTHAVIPALDPSGTPASLSRRIITGFIRGTLGYRGLIISDTLPMGAIDTYMSIPAAAVQAAAAGNDIVLVAFYQGLPPTIMHAALNAVLQAVETDHISTATVDSAARHVLLLKAKLGLL